MGEPAVPAPHGKVAAADGQVMRAGDMAVPAFGRLDELPEIITTDLRERSFFADILNAGYENPGCPAVVAGNLRLVWHSLDDLVGNLFAMVTVCTVPREDKPVAHER